MFHFFAAAVVLLVSYFLGCINGAVMVSHFIIRDDVRNHGSGNAGLTNFYRTYGAKFALAVIAIDMGKTVVATLIGGFMLEYLLHDWTLGVLLGGLGCEIGHMFPVFFGFKGGKGILCGSVLVWFLDWRVAVIAWVLFFSLWLLTRYVSLGSVSAAASIPISVLIFFGLNWTYIVLCILISGLAIYCHRENIRRLLNGTENKFKWHVNPVPLPDDSKNESEAQR